MSNKRYACIGLSNPKSPSNVGAIMRAAGCYGAASVFYTGTRYDRAKDFITDTKKVYQDIPLINIDDLRKILPLGCVPVAVELVEGARARNLHRRQAGRHSPQVRGSHRRTRLA